MATTKPLSEETKRTLLARLNEAENTGDRETVKDIRRYIAKEYGVDAYRDGRTMQWNVAGARPPHGKPEKDDEEKTPHELLEAARRALEDAELGNKQKKESRFRELFNDRPERRDRPDHVVDGSLQDVVERVRRTIADGSLSVPPREVLKEARRRMQEYRAARPNWYEGDSPWRVPKEQAAQPPPPELPPDVHTPTEEETMASISDYFKQEIGT